MLVDFGLMSRKHDGINILNRFFKVLKDYRITSKVLTSGSNWTNVPSN